MDIRSRCIHCENSLTDQYGAVSFPIYQSATFSHPGVGESTGYDYSRMQNPTREQLEKTLCALEGGADALAFSSGMAAVSALLELFEPPCHIIASDDLYGGTHRLFEHIGRKNGILFDYVHTSDVNEIQKAIRPSTRAIFIETPTNPMMQVSDIAGISALGREHGVLTIVDNTFLTPYFQRPLALGADIAVHSGTKYLSGHNDTIAGFLVVRSTELSEKLRFILKTTGACLSPMDSWLTLRGIKTLAVRMEKQQENAFAVADWLQKHPRIAKVYYIGLPSHPSYSLSRKQASGFGAMISFETDSEEAAVRILQNVRMIQYAESLGGVESLITYPMLQTHADIPEQVREARGITKKLLRLSVGLEFQDDLIEDLRRAIED